MRQLIVLILALITSTNSSSAEEFTYHPAGNLKEGSGI